MLTKPSSGIDSVISVDIPDPQRFHSSSDSRLKEADPVLHKIITKPMIDGSCGNINIFSSFMKDGKCCQVISQTVIE